MEGCVARVSIDGDRQMKDSCCEVEILVQPSDGGREYWTVCGNFKCIVPNVCPHHIVEGIERYEWKRKIAQHSLEVEERNIARYDVCLANLRGIVK